MKKYGDSLWKEAEEIKARSLKLSWYMRGGTSYNDILNMSIAEVNALQKVIDDNLETTKKTKLPFF